MKRSNCLILAGILFKGVFFLSILTGLWAADPYVNSIEEWRRDRQARLRADDGWLTVAGLFWLREGANTFGTDASNDIDLPEGAAASRAGVIEHTEYRTVLRYANDPGRTIEMKPDSSGTLSEPFTS